MRRLCMFVPLVLLMSVGSSEQLALNSESPKQMALFNGASMPLCFTENDGQWDERALFKAEAGGATFWFCKDQVVYQFTRNAGEPIKNGLPENSGISRKMPDRLSRPQYQRESMVLRAEFEGANPGVELIGEARLSHNKNYFLGNNPSKWASDVANWSSVTYRNIYQGIDLKYHGNGQGMKYDFIVSPGADISQIRIRYGGVNNISITSNGDLEASTTFGPVHEKIPEIYQETGSGRQQVSGRYVMIEAGVFGFEVDDYNPSYPLIIDPELVYSTYLGGNDYDYAGGIKVDGSGFAYVTGLTYSTDFPTQDPYQTNHSGEDVYVTKLAVNGDYIVYSTILGGDGDDSGYSIGLDSLGSAYLTGYTNSSNFPTQNPFQGAFQGTWDAFAVKLSPLGNSLIYSTYLGGTGYDEGFGIAVDQSGFAYVTGEAFSSDFPTKNPYQTDQAGWDAFAVKLSLEGDSLVYGTYLGGIGWDYGYGITVDISGSAYVTGYTNSSDFPTQNPFQSFNESGSDDAFVTKLSGDGQSLSYSTYLGGNGNDYGYSVAVDTFGSAFVTGYTDAPDFPTQNPYQATNQGLLDAFVTKIAVGGGSLVYSTYLGGDGDEYGQGISVDGSGAAIVTGLTFSSSFPTRAPYQMYMGNADAFVTRLSPSGDFLLASTYLGGNGDDYGQGIALDDSGYAYVIGYTNSTDFPTQNPYQTYQANYDVFVTKFSMAVDTPLVISTNPGMNLLNVSVATNISATFDIDMDPASINDSTFIVYGRSSGRHPGAISYDGPSRTATFNPTIDFQAGEIVNATLTTDVHSLSGGLLESGHSWSFTTAVSGGSGVFAAPVSFDVNDQPSSVFGSDLDGDGYNDLAVTNYISNNVSILRNNGDGTFQPMVNYDVGDVPSSIFACDLDGDGDNDLVTANSSSNNVSILRNNGDGTFQPMVNYDVGGIPMSIFACDLDGNGYNDLAVANRSSSSVSIMTNNGDGTFQAPVDYGAGTWPNSVFACDLDGDGYNDLAVANYWSDYISILRNNGNGTFQTAANYGIASQSRSVFASDLDGDGDNDLAVTNDSTGSVYIFKNSGDGTFQYGFDYQAGAQPMSVFACDLNGDGNNDLAVANYMSQNVTVMFNSGSGTFWNVANYEIVSNPYSVFGCDLDGDGDNDLAVADSGNRNISILRNLNIPRIYSVYPTQNDLNIPVYTHVYATFETEMDSFSVNDSTFIVSGSSSGRHAGIFSYTQPDRWWATFNQAEDFVPGEVVTATLTTGIRSADNTPLDSSFSWSFTVLVDSSTAVFDTLNFTPADSGVYWVVCADLNGDSCLDMATANTGANSVSVLFNDCQGNFSLSQDYPVGISPTQVAAADFNGDGHIDLASADSGSGTVSVLVNHGDGTFDPAVSYLTGVGAWGLFCADFSGDGDVDIAVTTGGSGYVAILENNGDGTFPSSPSQLLSTGEGAFGVFVADLNSDHQPDIAVTTGSVNSIKTFINDGGGGFPPTPSGSYESGGSTWGLFGADLNGDGKIDLAATNPDTRQVTVHLNQGDGTFPVIFGSYETEGSAWGIFGGDFDGDGDIDLAITIPDSGTVIVMINNGDGVFPEDLFGSYETPGSSWGIFAADLNGDGTLDLAVANSDSNGVSELWNEPINPLGGYQYVVGDVNGSGNFNGLDVVYSVSYFKGGPPPSNSYECPIGSGIIWYVSGDVNASCNFNGLDVSYMVSYLKGGPPPNPCADCPPALLLAPPKRELTPSPASETILLPNLISKPEMANGE